MKHFKHLWMLLAAMLLSINVWGDTWTRCTAVADVTSGGTFIIGYEATANSGKIIPMKNTGGTATTSAAGYMANGSEINMATVTTTTDYEFTIVASTSVTGAVCIKCGNNFIGNTNTKNNCKLFTEEATTTSYGVTVGTNDVFTFKIAANTTYHTLQYNTGSPRFAVYGGGQKNLVLYKKSTSGGSTETAVNVDVKEGEKLEVGKTLNVASLFNVKTSNYTGTLSYAIKNDANKDNATLAGTTLTGVKAGTVTIVASAEKSGDFAAVSKEATVTITAPVEVTNLDGSITYNFSTFTQGNDVTFDGTNYTIEFHKNTGSTAPQWNVMASEARVYAAGSVVVKAAQGYAITKIVYGYTVHANSGGVSPTVNGAAGSINAGTWDVENKTWTGSDATVTLSTSGSAGNLGFKTITVTLAEVTVAELIGIEATGTPAEFWKGDAFNHNGITVTALWDDENETDVTSECEFSGYDMATPGQQNVTVTYQGETTTYDIEVKTIANTKENAYSVAQAKALIDAGKDLTTKVYVKGTVSQIDSYNSDFGSITYWISADGTTANQFEVYGGLALGSEAKFSAKTDLTVGDDVIVYGVIKKWGSAYEFDKNNYLVKWDKTATLSIADITVADGKDITPVITTNIVGEYTIKYESNKEDVVLAADDEMVTMGTGEATITATITATGYKTAKITFTVTVTTNATLESVTISGDLENATYTYGDAFDKSGLTANAHYSNGDNVDVTSTATWTFNGQSALTLTASGDVNVVATFNEMASTAKVCAVTVNKKASSIVIENIELEATRTATIEATTTPAGAELTYTIEEGDAYISIEDGVITGVAEGTATVRADYAGTAEYEAASKTFTVNVVPFVPTFTWSDENLTSDTKLSTVTTDADPVSIVFAKGEASSEPQYYTNGDAVRFYKSNTLTISGKNGKLIKQVIVNYVSSGYAETLTPNVGTYGVDGAVGTWTGMAEVVVLTNGVGSCRFNSIVVSYVDGTVTTLTIADMSLKPSDGATTIVYESNKVNPVIVYSNYDEAVITIAEGKVTPVAKGNTTVTATIAQEGTYTAATTTFTVTVANKTATTLSFPETAYSVKANETFTAPTLTTTPAGLTGIKYTSSNTDAAEVDETTGAVTVKAVGTTTIKATFAETADYKASEASYELAVLDPYADVLTAGGIDVTSYGDWNDKTFTTATKYAGNSTTGNQAPNIGAIQVRTTNSNSGIVSTETMGYIKSVSVDFSTVPGSGKSLDIYGSHAAYTSAADLYDNNKCGTKIGSATENGVVTLAEGNYEFVGVRSSSGAMYLNSISISWTPVTFLNVSVAETTHGTVTVDKTSCVEDAEVTITATPDEDYELASLKAYKTGDEATEVTITEGKFTMPAYDVTIAAEFTLIPVVRPEGDEYALVAQSGEKYYALTMTPNGNHMSATEVTVWNGMVRVAADSEKENIAWIRNNTDASSYTFQTPTAKYLTATSGETYLKLGKTEQKWAENTNGSYSAVSRTIGLATTDFRNYASASNPAKAMPIVVIGADAVAVIGNTAYNTLADAVAAVPTDGTETTITMLADVELTAALTIANTKNVVLDLNGKTIKNEASVTLSQLITVNGKLTVDDKTTAKAGKILNTANNKYVLATGAADAELTLANGTVQSTTGATAKTIYASKGMFVMTGGKIISTGYGVSAATVNISGGEIEAYDMAVSAGGTITGGTFTSATKYAVYTGTSGNKQMALSGGTFTPAAGKVAVQVYNANAIVSGGTFNVSGAEVVGFASNATGMLLAGTGEAYLAATHAAFYDGETLVGYAPINTGLFASTIVSGKTVKLTKNVATTTYINVTKSFTLDLNSHDITCTPAKADAVFATKGTASSPVALTIKGDGKISCGDHGEGCNAIQVSNYSTINIEGGEFAVPGDNSTIYMLAATAAGASTVNISGGEFKSGDGKFVLNINDDVRAYNTFVVTGGKFQGFNPANNSAEGEHTNFCAAGYVAHETSTGIFEVVEASTDATLSDLKVAGETIADFSAATTEYSVELPYDATVAPVVTATATIEFATYEITAATALPGATTIVVTAEDGTTTKTYTVNFTLGEAPYVPVRGDLTVDSYGTICLEKEVVAFKGATFYAVSHIEGSEVVLVEVSKLVAGYPYVFVADEETIGVIYGTETATEALSHNGLIGSFTRELLPAGKYIIYNDMLYATGSNNYVGAHKAYFDLSEMSTEAVAAPGQAPAPQRRRISMESNTTTGMMNTNDNDHVNKMLINGQLYIIRGGKMFNAAGQLVK